MASLNQQIFDIIKSVPYIDRPNIHRTMASTDAAYSAVSGNATIARLLRAKYIRRDLNSRFVAHVDKYEPLPPFAKNKKKKPVKKKDILAAAGTQYREAMMMNTYVPPPMTEYKIAIAPKKSFFTKLRELFSD